MVRVDRIVNYASISIILFVGILFLTGVIGFLDSSYRIGFGIVIILYGAIRLAMTYVSDRGRAKKP
jgi:hypothetical protein